jgi:hypothetical protein
VKSGLATALCAVVQEALRNLDLLGTHTGNGSKRKRWGLRFDPHGTKTVDEISNRTGERRPAILLRLVIRTPEAAAFLFKYGGYSLMKLEQSLGGVLIGLLLRMQKSSSEPSYRLRIGPQLEPGAVKNVRKVWRVAKEIKSIPVD